MIYRKGGSAGIGSKRGGTNNGAIMDGRRSGSIGGALREGKINEAAMDGGYPREQGVGETRTDRVEDSFWNLPMLLTIFRFDDMIHNVYDVVEKKFE